MLEGSDIHEEIAALEARIEALEGAIELSRRLSLAAKLLIAGGAAAIALMLLGWLNLGALAFLLACATTIAGIVLLGSNASSWNETEAERSKAEARRRELIGKIDLRVVGDQRVLH